MTPVCRFCRTPLTQTVVDLGRQPLANSNLTAAELAAGTERTYPLHARVCPSCFLVQVDDPVAADEIFDSGYAYFSSYSASWVEHARRYAQAMIARFGLGPQSLVVEVASNDGYLLQHFKAAGVPVLGIEPTANTAQAAIDRGVPTEVMFFHGETGRELAARGVKADLMAANNVLAHVPDIGGFVAGFREVLKPEGVLTFEFPHLLNMLEMVQFDTIYHEHFSYLSLLAVAQVLRANGLRAFDVELLPTHGGSLRLFCAHEGSSHRETEALKTLRAREAAAGLHRLETYEGYAARVDEVRDSFLAFLKSAKAEGKSVAAYGAAAKGNTFLNYAGVGTGDLVAAFDANPHKQGRYLPGSHVPILAPDKVAEVKPDYILILPWNLKDEIMAQLAYVRAWGCRFVIASPKTEILD
ncbi:class I SAM-dependent methyltransferase [Phenylobacterium sp.]|uniref:class I SAM-dependent methyltransferase n=1 Tax=Phenylobacterium sp. TaxID=1871053 RepID=UPI002FD94C52